MNRPFLNEIIGEQQPEHVAAAALTFIAESLDYATALRVFERIVDDGAPVEEC